MCCALRFVTTIIKPTPLSTAVPSKVTGITEGFMVKPQSPQYNLYSIGHGSFSHLSPLEALSVVVLTSIYMPILSKSSLKCWIAILVSLPHSMPQCPQPTLLYFPTWQAWECLFPIPTPIKCPLAFGRCCSSDRQFFDIGRDHRKRMSIPS